MKGSPPPRRSLHRVWAVLHGSTGSADGGPSRSRVASISLRGGGSRLRRSRPDAAARASGPALNAALVAEGVLTSAGLCPATACSTPSTTGSARTWSPWRWPGRRPWSPRLVAGGGPPGRRAGRGRAGGPGRPVRPRRSCRLPGRGAPPGPRHHHPGGHGHPLRRGAGLRRRDRHPYEVATAATPAASRGGSSGGWASSRPSAAGPRQAGSRPEPTATPAPTALRHPAALERRLAPRRQPRPAVWRWWPPAPALADRVLGPAAGGAVPGRAGALPLAPTVRAPETFPYARFDIARARARPQSRAGACWPPTTAAISTWRPWPSWPPGSAARCASWPSASCSTPRSVGWVARAIGGIPVDRGSGGGRAAARGRGGAAGRRGGASCSPRAPSRGARRSSTRCSTARPGTARLAAATGAPVVPVGLWGTEQVWPALASSARHRRGPRIPRRCTVRVGRPVDLGLGGRGRRHPDAHGGHRRPVARRGTGRGASRRSKSWPARYPHGMVPRDGGGAACPTPR